MIWFDLRSPPGPAVHKPNPTATQRYYIESKEMKRVENYRTLENEMSIAMRGDVALANNKWCVGRACRSFFSPSSNRAPARVAVDSVSLVDRRRTNEQMNKNVCRGIVE